MTTPPERGPFALPPIPEEWERHWQALPAASEYTAIPQEPRASVAMMIYYIRKRAAEAGKPLDDVTDEEINRRGIGIEYIWPEIIQDVVAGTRALRPAGEALAEHVREVTETMAELAKAYGLIGPTDGRIEARFRVGEKPHD